jgi:hypothetical protein
MVNRIIRRPGKSQWILLIFAIALGAYIVASILPNMPLSTGKLDFRAYWSASFLLLRGENFADMDSLHQVEKTKTGWNARWTLRTWEPPWVLAWFIPLAAMNFDQAANLLLVTNFLLLFVSVAAIWRLNAAKPLTKRFFWLPLIALILFPSTILVFIYGQVGLILVAGLAGFMYLYHESHDLSAGAILSLTMVKPHLVYLTLPLIFLVTLKERRWKVAAGFGLVLLASLAIVYVLRPTFLEDFLSGSVGAGLLNWQNPTLPSYIHYRFGWSWIRLIGIILFPLMAYFWYRRGNRFTLGELVDITILVSVITAPFGWSYDFVVLLLPLVRIWLWVIEGVLTRLESVAIVVLMAAVYLVYFQQRVSSPSEIYYFWIPLVIAALYGWACYRKQQTRPMTP